MAQKKKGTAKNELAIDSHNLKADIPEVVAAIDHLSIKCQTFVLEYLRTYSTTAAAARAGINRHTGNVWLHREDVRDAIRRLMADKVMSVSEALARLSEHARVDARDVLTIWEDEETGEEYATIDVAKAIRNGKSHLITEVGKTKEGLKVKMVDPQKALDRILQLHGVIGGNRTPKDERAFRGMFDDDDAEDAVFEILE